jgi:FRG domain
MRPTDLVLKSEDFAEEHRFPDSEYKVTTVSKLLRLLTKLQPKRGGDRWIYRGVSDSTHSLEASVQRCVVRDSERATALRRTLIEFQASAHLFPECGPLPLRNDYLSWLAIMQHFGAPTNLLDWTRSPYVALFFATSDFSNKEDRNSALWMLNEWKVYRLLRELPRVTEIFAEDERFEGQAYSHPDMFRRLFAYSPQKRRANGASRGAITVAEDDEFILPCSPSRRNPRILAQQGCFTYISNVRINFAGNLSNMVTGSGRNRDLSQLLLKIEFPTALAPEIVQVLESMNISGRTMYPGLEGFARKLYIQAAAESELPQHNHNYHFEGVDW